MIDLKTRSYIYGLFLADGSYSKVKGTNKERISLEMIDKDILQKIHRILKLNNKILTRKRNTNFIKNHTSYILNINSKKLINIFKRMGLPNQKKSLVANVPLIKYSERDFWRGFIDGDGTLGISKNGIPFLGLCSKSEELIRNYQKFLTKKLKRSFKCNRNFRDKIYNLTIYRSAAIQLTSILYPKNCLSIKRKHQISKIIKKLKFKRKRTIDRTFWNKEKEKELLMIGEIKFRNKYKKSKSSVYMKYNRLIGKYKRLEPLAVVKG